ncbi:hypothetical protein U1Q18_029684, partial [Sarracenia purpurea var. burkii]
MFIVVKIDLGSSSTDKSSSVVASHRYHRALSQLRLCCPSPCPRSPSFIVTSHELGFVFYDVLLAKREQRQNLILDLDS